MILASANCFSTGWNPIGEILFKCGPISTLAVDDDFNIYTAQWNVHSLQKWLPNTNKSIDLFEGRFQSSAIFYHSLSHSLYFVYVFNNKPGVYKLTSPIDENSVPVMVFTSSGRGSALNQLDGYCTGLYVTSIGEIYVVDTNNNRVMKWVENGTSGIIVAGGYGHWFEPDHIGNPSGLFVDEINNVFYIKDTDNRRIQRFSNAAINGTTVIGGGATTVLSDVLSEYIQPLSLLGDKNGNLFVGEIDRITKWTSDIKSNIVIASRDNLGLRVNQEGIYLPALMTFDKFENLYVYDSGSQTIYKFIRNSISCIRNLH